jgi:ABC-type polysaccharide/polyol phosphate export permease
LENALTLGVLVYKLVYDSRESQKGPLGTLKLVSLRFPLFLTLLKFELLTKYKKSVLGLFWSFLNPLMISSVIYFVFGKLFNSYMPLNRGYGTYVVSGVLLQLLLLQGMTACSGALQAALPMIVKNRVEPGLQVLVSSSAHAMHFTIGATSLIPLALLSHQPISLRVLLLPFFIYLAILLIAGFGMLLVPWFLRYDDAQFLFNAFLMIVGYLTPIFYPISILNETMRTLVMFNPMTHWIIVFRWLFFENQEIVASNLLIVIATSLLSFALGVRSLRKKWNAMVML